MASLSHFLTALEFHGLLVWPVATRTNPPKSEKRAMAVTRVPEMLMEGGEQGLLERGQLRVSGVPKSRAPKVCLQHLRGVRVSRGLQEGTIGEHVRQTLLDLICELHALKLHCAAAGLHLVRGGVKNGPEVRHLGLHGIPIHQVLQPRHLADHKRHIKEKRHPRV